MLRLGYWLEPSCTLRSNPFRQKTRRPGRDSKLFLVVKYRRGIVFILPEPRRYIVAQVRYFRKGTNIFGKGF